MGLDRAKLLVRRLLSRQSGVHAVLFYGATGSGKSVLAETLTEAWLCRNVSDDGADGTCQACGAFSRGQSPDLLRIQPEGPSAIIKVTSITNDNMEKDHPTPLRMFLRTGPLMSRHKVALISDAHRLNKESANALLKTLEEPELYAKLILTTDSIGSVIPTILSRCLVVSCEMAISSEIKRLGMAENEDFIRLAEGAPGKLKVFAAKPEPYRRLAHFAKTLRKRAPREALSASEEFKSICDSLDSKVVRVGHTEGLALLATYLAREPHVDPRWTRVIAETHRRVRSNAQAGISFDALFARLLTM